MKEYWGMLGLLLVTIIWGAGFTASDIALQSLEPFQIMLTGKAVEKYRPMALNFVQMATACICSLAGLVCGRNVKVSFTAGGVLSVLYLGAVSTALTYLLQTLSQRYVDETKAAVILSLEAAFGCLFSVLLLKEHITLRMLAGAGMILSAVLIPEIKWKRRLIGNGVGKEENGGKK